ncbi:protein KASH5-like [Labrus bergylta]|uniref:protein KASH5-like n=1 Tax=Labrus bergylta TaxID=56723 RepID=UPI0033142C06
MLEKIAELDYSQSQLRELNVKMRLWLDVADDDMAALRSENSALNQQVKILEKIINTAQHVEAEPCRSLLADDFNAKRCSEKKFQALEKESVTLKDQNKKLTISLKILQQDKEKDKENLSKIKDSVRSLEYGLEDAQLGLLHREEVIHQKNVQLQHSEELVEECSNIIKELRLTNQELRTQLEDRLYDASFPGLNDAVREKGERLNPPLSFADEMKLLASSDEEQTIIADPTDLRPEETEAEELLQPPNLTADIQSISYTGTLGTSLQRAGLFLLFVFMLIFLVFVASGSRAGNFFSINTLWSGARLILQPYCSVHYGALPPI